MSDYRAPLRDMHFVMQELFDCSTHYAALPGGEQFSADLVSAVLNEHARFCEDVLAPLNRSGDEEGCQWTNGEVTAPQGFREAYRSYAEAGWTSLPWSEAYGGQGLPMSLNKVIMEMSASANMAFSLYTSAQPGAIETISTYGTPEQRDTYERNLVDGTWNATMCLTEAHCGTDLGMLRTQAIPTEDGAYAISGSKIFITGGEHDFNENIIHLVLARIQGSPEGTGGISLFIVPKYLVGPGGQLGARNAVACGSIEHKMGVKGSATCVMNFDGATGYLLGEPNRGLSAMFTFINASRVSAANQGVAHAELGFQKSLAYSRERLQMRSMSGVKNPDGPADPIIVHPDVRRMLFTQKAFAEGNRMLTYYLAMHLDLVERSNSAEERAFAQKRLDFMTPIAKAFATETGVESANLGLQCFGGHGYIREWCVEQNVRDARIATLYEGTTGIQALDLLSRKVISSGGELVKTFTDEILEFCNRQNETGTSEISPFFIRLEELVEEWLELTELLCQRATSVPDDVGAASVSYLMYSGYICLAFFWARAASVALSKCNESSQNPDFYRSKLATAKFYYQYILPRVRICVEIMGAGSGALMDLDADHFQF